MIWILLLLLALPSAAFGAIAHETSVESHTGTTGNTSSASFDLTVAFTASSRGLLVFTYNANSNANDATSVKINPAGANTDVPAVTGGLAVDTAGEPGSCKAWFLGAGLPTSSGTVRINRNNNANIMYAVAITMTGSTSSTSLVGTPVLQQGDGAIAESAVDSGAATAIRYACGYNGGNTPPTAGANSTLLQSIDFGAFTAAAARETTPGTGSRSAGLVVASDDRAAVTLAFADVLACTGTSWTSTGTKAEANQATADSGTIVLDNTKSGSFIAVSASIFDSDATPSSVTISDDHNGTYTSGYYTTVGAGNGGIGMAYFPTNAGGQLTITVNPQGASADWYVAAHEFCGGATSSVASGAASTGTGTSTTAATGSIVPVGNDVLVLASMVAQSVPISITENAGSEGFTLSNEQETPQHGSLVYKIISGAPGTPSESWTLGGTANWAAGIAAFKPNVASASTTLLDSLISYWELEEASGTRVDRHGSNDLTDNNTVTATTGKVGSAASFALANSEYLNRADNASLSVGDIDFTFCAWTQIASKVTGDSLTITSKGTSTDGVYYFSYVIPPGDHFQLTVYGAAAFANGDTVNATTFGSPTTNTWYYVCAWHDSTANTLSIQVNNGTVDSVAHTTGAFDDTGNFSIGSGWPHGASPGEFMDGLIDQVGFWKRILTADERTALYNSGNGLTYAALPGTKGAVARRRAQ